MAAINVAHHIRFPHVTVQLTDRDGNAFAILGRTCQALRAAGATEKEIADYMHQATSLTYAHLLNVTAQWVQVR